jgi:hypothetical protein
MWSGLLLMPLLLVRPMVLLDPLDQSRDAPRLWLWLKLWFCMLLHPRPVWNCWNLNRVVAVSECGLRMWTRVLIRTERDVRFRVLQRLGSGDQVGPCLLLCGSHSGNLGDEMVMVLALTCGESDRASVWNSEGWMFLNWTAACWP